MSIQFLATARYAFCIDGITHGIAHHLETRAPPSHAEAKCPTNMVKLTRCFQHCAVCNAMHGSRSFPQTTHGCNIWEYLCASRAGMFINMTCEASTHKLLHNAVVSDDMNETLLVPNDVTEFHPRYMYER